MLTHSRQTKKTGLFGLLLTLGLVTAAHAQNPDWVLPRTIDGHPDFQGVWANNSITPLQRPEVFADRQQLSAEEFARLQTKAQEIAETDGDALFGDGFLGAVLAGEITSYDPSTGNYDQSWMVQRELENRTSLIVDPANGRLPAFTQEAQQRMAQRPASRRDRPDSYLDLPLQERCITYGMPYILAGYNSYYQIVQSKHTVAIVQEMIHDVRIIPLQDKPPIADSIRLWHGDSRGWWEGDTLVVETRNFSPKSEFLGAGANRLFTERYTRVAEDVLRYEFTLEDASTWTSPWTAVINYTRSEDPIFEYACHEGNYALEGILSGARAQDRAEGL
ncbi:MAG: hypothetical protein RQ757_00180 [Pseudomonadales bacterium]|nr:hypothetical protein [Pseudomonadales bacterium]